MNIRNNEGAADEAGNGYRLRLSRWMGPQAIWRHNALLRGSRSFSLQDCIFFFLFLRHNTAKPLCSDTAPHSCPTHVEELGKKNGRFYHMSTRSPSSTTNLCGLTKSAKKQPSDSSDQTYSLVTRMKGLKWTTLDRSMEVWSSWSTMYTPIRCKSKCLPHREILKSYC